MARQKIDLKTFRRDFGRLRRKGLVSAPSKFFKGKEAPLRSVQPTPANLSALKKYSDILKGQAKAISAKRVVKMSAADLARLGARRVKTPTGEKIVVKAASEQKVTTTKKQITIRDKEFDLVKLPNQVDQFRISDLDPDLLPKASRDEYWSFRLAGNPAGGWGSERTFRTTDAMMKYLSEYRVFIDDDTFNDGIELLQIYKFKRVIDFEMTGHRRTRRKSTPEKRKRQRAQTNTRTPEWKKQENREIAARKARAYRAEIKKKGGPEYEEYKRKSRERTRKSRS